MARDNKTLGNFKLDGIKAAPRGMNAIEVSFDIDSNGIVNVAAKEQATGKEQKITITASTNLTKEDIERLLKEATANAAADSKVKDEADVRNEAYQACYAVEHLLKDGGEKIRDTNRSRSQLLINELRQKLEKHESIADIKKMTADVQALMSMLQQDISAAAPAGANGSNGNSSSPAAKPKEEEDIVDAEVSSV
jgi:molecular chaperone DnaK